MDQRPARGAAAPAACEVRLGLRSPQRQRRDGRVPARAPQGSRFAGPDLGAWYAASALETAVLELVNGIRREIALSALQQKTEELREYTAHLEGEFVDIRGARPDLHDPDPATYSAAQVFGRSVRTGPHDGIVYDSVRHPGGVNWVSYRPTQIIDVLQAQHFRVVVPRSGKVLLEQLGPP